MTKEEEIAKLREALERLLTWVDPMAVPGCLEHEPDVEFARAALSLPSSSEPPQPGEIEIAAAELVDKFNRAQWYLNDDCDGLDDDGCAILRALVVEAIQTVREAKS